MSVNFDNSCIHIFSTAEVKICKIIQTILEIIQKSQRIFFFFFTHKASQKIYNQFNESYCLNLVILNNNVVKTQFSIDMNAL